MPLTHPPLFRLLRSRWLLDSRFIGGLAAALPGGSLLAWAHFVEPYRLELTHHAAPLGDTPGGRPIRLLHLSDLHFREDARWERSVVEALAGVGCDLLVITGDLVHLGARPEEVGRLLTRLPPARLGRFVCPGNWDRWSLEDEGVLRRMIAPAGLRLLNNEAVVIEDGARRFALIGVDDLLSGAPDLEVVRRAPAGLARVVLSHTPTLFPALAHAGATLVLSGHTHGGQIRLPGRGALWMPVGSGHYDAGWFTADGARLFVSRGIGMSVAPLRLLCRPEAALITL